MNMVHPFIMLEFDRHENSWKSDKVFRIRIEFVWIKSHQNILRSQSGFKNIEDKNWIFLNKKSHQK